MRYVYIAGPYVSPKGHNHHGYHDIERNIAQAREAAMWLANNGIGFFCPHMNAAHNEVITPDVSVEFWYEMDLHFLPACDAVLLLPGWEESKGAQEERNEAERRGMQLFHFSLASAREALLYWAGRL